eukprot:12637293-Alexandrium_andersonii.AAC.1
MQQGRDDPAGPSLQGDLSFDDADEGEMEELSTQQSVESESPATEKSSSQVRVGRGNSSFPPVNGARALGWGN